MKKIPDMSVRKAFSCILPADLGDDYNVPQPRPRQHGFQTPQIEDDFPRNIWKWMESKRSVIQEAFYLKGGWEGWLQVELALWLKCHLNMEVLREQEIYQDKSRADILVRTPGSQCNVRQIIELKCEGVEQDCRPLKAGLPPVPKLCRSPEENRLIPAIAKRLEDDWAKRSKVKESMTPCQYIVIGVSLSEEAQQWVLEQNRVKDPGEYFTPSYLKSEANDHLVMWYRSEILSE